MKMGFKDLDNIITLNSGELIVIASRPAMGKTTLVQNILSNVSIKNNKGVLFFSLEYSKQNVANNLIIRNAMIEKGKYRIYDKYKNSNYASNIFSKEEFDRLIYATNLLKDKPIYIESDAPYTINEICRKAYKLKYKNNIELIIIDYLQLIQFDKTELLSRDNEIDKIMKSLKILAKELNVPIIITAQLSRKLEKRKDKKPYINDFANLKNSILKYTDKILFLYRESYYNENSKTNITDVIVARNNDGSCNTINLAWMPEYCMFGNTIILEGDKYE